MTWIHNPFYEATNSIASLWFARDFLDQASAVRLNQRIQRMVEGRLYHNWYEDALVQMIFEENFQLFARDISQYQWTEVDNVDDLMYAKASHQRDGA